MGYATVPISMAIALMARYRPASRGKHFGTDRGRSQRFRSGFLLDTFRILLVHFDGVHSKILFLDLCQVIAVKIGHGKLPEYIIDDRCGHFDTIVQFDRPIRLETGKHERFDELLQWNAMLEAQ